MMIGIAGPCFGCALTEGIVGVARQCRSTLAGISHTVIHSVTKGGGAVIEEVAHWVIAFADGVLGDQSVVGGAIAVGFSGDGTIGVVGMGLPGAVTHAIVAKAILIVGFAFITEAVNEVVLVVAGITGIDAVVDGSNVADGVVLVVETLDALVATHCLTTDAVVVIKASIQC